MAQQPLEPSQAAPQSVLLLPPVDVAVLGGHATPWAASPQRQIQHVSPVQAVLQSKGGVAKPEPLHLLCAVHLQPFEKGRQSMRVVQGMCQERAGKWLGKERWQREGG